MNLKLSVFLLTFLFITSCGSGKMIVGSEIANSSMSPKDMKEILIYKDLRLVCEWKKTKKYGLKLLF